MKINKILLNKVQKRLKMFNLNKKKIRTSDCEEDIFNTNASTIIPKEFGKNKWLYPADEFVAKWKKPKIHKSQTFEL